MNDKDDRSAGAPSPSPDSVRRSYLVQGRPTGRPFSRPGAEAPVLYK
ncbi:hypothetical protein [uncultured Cloacibacillus sp.]